VRQELKARLEWVSKGDASSNPASSKISFLRGFRFSGWKIDRCKAFGHGGTHCDGWMASSDEALSGVEATVNASWRGATKSAGMDLQGKDVRDMVNAADVRHTAATTSLQNRSQSKSAPELKWGVSSIIPQPPPSPISTPVSCPKHQQVRHWKSSSSEATSSYSSLGYQPDLRFQTRNSLVQPLAHHLQATTDPFRSIMCTGYQTNYACGHRVRTLDTPCLMANRSCPGVVVGPPPVIDRRECAPCRASAAAVKAAAKSNPDRGREPTPRMR